jgi:hypothetical protein
MSTRPAHIAAQHHEPVESSQATDTAAPARIAPLRDWLTQVADLLAVQLIVAPSVPRERLDTPLLGSVVGQPSLHTLEALAFAGDLCLVLDGDLVHLEPRPGQLGVWRLVTGSHPGPPHIARKDRDSRSSAGELVDATLSYALARCAGELGAAMFAHPAVYDPQPLVRLTGDERGTVRVVAALAASCEAIAVGFGDEAFVLATALPSEDGFDRLNAHVWTRRTATADVAGAACRVVSLDVPEGSVESQAAALAAAVGATAMLGGPDPGPSRRIGRLRAEGRFSDVADIWCGLRRLEWSLVSGPAGVEFVVRAATGAPTLSPPRN